LRAHERRKYFAPKCIFDFDIAGDHMNVKIGVSVAMLLGVAQAAYAADLPTTKPPAPSPAPQCWGSMDNFLNTTAQDCPLSLYGITLYGVLDMGVGYETHGARWNGHPSTVDFLVAKPGGHSLWLPSPNAMTTSYVGVKIAEPLWGDWSFVGNLQVGYIPFSLHVADGLRSMVENNGVPLQNQSANGDSSRAGQWYNGVAYAGLSSTTFGTLTAGRQNSLLLDNVAAYDPMGGSNAFSLIGYSGVTAGGGQTEDARYATSIKYRDSYGPVHFGVLYDFGGYSAGNAAQSAWQLDGGFDYGKFSFDTAFSKVNGAVSASTWPAPVVPAYAIGTLKATISDNTAWMFAGKYDFGQVKLYGGYENVYFAAPGNPVTAPFIGEGGYTFSSVNNAAYAVNNKVLQIFWTGAKYSVRDDLDLIGAFYYETQNDYSGKPCSNTSLSTCSGKEVVVSGVVDWRPYKRFDVYAGVGYSKVYGGLANGYLPGTTTEVDPTVGMRITF
jgi:predicted porin